MDGTRISQAVIRIDVLERAIPLSKRGFPGRVARKGEVLYGDEVIEDGTPWIVFPDGYRIQKQKLRHAWDDNHVDAWIEEDGAKVRELFDG